MVVAKTRTKWGKFRPWLFIGTLTNAVILYLMFAAPPKLDGNGLVAYAGSTTSAFRGCYLYHDDVPLRHWSMIRLYGGAEKREKDFPHSRAPAPESCLRDGGTIITMKCVYMLGQGNERVGFKWFALVVAILFFVFILITCLNIKEKSTVDVEAPSVGHLFRSLLQSLIRRLTVVVTIVLINCSIYGPSNLVIYFFKYDFGGDSWYNAYTLFNTFGGAMQILAMMLFFPILRKFLGTIQVFYTSFVMAILGYAVLLILMFVNMSNLYLLFVPAFFIFSANGMLSVLTTVFLANTVDYGEWKNHRRDESVIFSMQTFVVKLASGVAALVASICLTVCNLSQNTDGAAVAAAGSSVAGLRLTMTVFPIAGLLVAVFYFRKKYILSEQKVEEIAKEIKEMKKA
ncbi:MAG: MFS transporter [Roseburia intestinalis]